jgi:hypothetical protein
MYEDLCGQDDANRNVRGLMSLLPLAKKIVAVDLSEFTTYIELIGQAYCLCRNANHGTMIECETCNEWYHVPCLALTLTQVRRLALQQLHIN